MFDVAWSELALIGAVALVVIGPKDLPKVMRTLGQWTRKARLLAGEFQHGIDDMIRQAELDEVRRQVQAANPTAMKSEVENLIDPNGIKDALRVDPSASTVGTSSGAAAASTAEAAEAQAAAEIPVLPEGVLPSIPPVEDIAEAAAAPQSEVVVKHADKPNGAQL